MRAILAQLPELAGLVDLLDQLVRFAVEDAVAALSCGLGFLWTPDWGSITCPEESER